MANPIPGDIESFAEALAPDPAPIAAELAARAERENFPTVGPAIGCWFRLLAELVEAERIFEFGSGFGYSAYWFASALPAEGEIVLTEHDADELEDARGYLERAGLADRAQFEHGDALAAIDNYDGPFDVVLIDIDKDGYVAAFDAVEDAISPGGLILADNVLSAGEYVEFEGVRRLLGAERGDEPVDESRYTEGTRGIAAYLSRVRSAPGYRTTLLPLGEGVTVTRRTVSPDAHSDG